jgi:chaperonin GroES
MATVADLQPLEDRVIARRIEGKDDMSPGGIHIPDVAQTLAQEAIVVAVGPDAPKTLSKGDRILFGQYSGSLVKVGGYELMIMRPAEIFAKVVSSQPQPNAPRTFRQFDAPEKQKPSRKAKA